MMRVMAPCCRHRHHHPKGSAFEVAGERVSNLFRNLRKSVIHPHHRRRRRRRQVHMCPLHFPHPILFPQQKPTMVSLPK